MTSDKLRLLVETVQQLSLARDLESIMAVVRTVARKLTNSDGASFVLKDIDKCFYADEDAISPLWKGQRFPMTACISGWVMINKEPAIVPDIYLDNRIPIEAYKPTFVKSLTMVPIRKIDPIGAIGNYWAKQHSPTQEEVDLLQSLADITSVSIENVYVYNELERRVKQRTMDLENLNKELETFSYSVSHDLRAPLRSIIQYSNYLMEGASQKLNKEEMDDLKAIMRNGKRMNELINDLLEFSRTSRIELIKDDVNMGDMVKSIIEECIRQENGRIINYNMEELQNCTSDKQMIRQVWINLISNALKYSRGKDETIIKFGNYQENNSIVYYIKDNGTGFDMKYYNKLFGVFQRLHSAEDFEGTGVGLALVKQIINKHGGKVWANSEPGDGTTFYFSIPNEIIPV